MYREPENTVIGRETCIKLIMRIIAKIPNDRRILNDCRGHLDEMKRDPTYVPENVTIAKMTGG